MRPPSLFSSTAGSPPSMTPMLVGVVALCVNFFAILVETQAILANQDLVDRVAAALDKLDHEPKASGEIRDSPLNQIRVTTESRAIQHVNRVGFVRPNRGAVEGYRRSTISVRRRWG